MFCVITMTISSGLKWKLDRPALARAAHDLHAARARFANERSSVCLYAWIAGWVDTFWTPENRGKGRYMQNTCHQELPLAVIMAGFQFDGWGDLFSFQPPSKYGSRVP